MSTVNAQPLHALATQLAARLCDAHEETGAATKALERTKAHGRLAAARVATAALSEEWERVQAVLAAVDGVRPYLLADRGLAVAAVEEFQAVARVGGRKNPVPDGLMKRIAIEEVMGNITERLEVLEGGERDLVSIDERDDEPIDQLQLTRAEWEFMKRIVLVELFAPRPRPERPSDSAPGSPDRERVMGERLERGEAIFHPDDTTPATSQRPLATKMRVGGKHLDTQYETDGLKVTGWGPRLAG